MPCRIASARHARSASRCSPSRSAPSSHKRSTRWRNAWPLALAHIKHAIRAAAGNSLTPQLALERDLQRELGYSEDFMEGVTAFFGKRAPRFKGR
jgi:enoyl-CoA hydratase/carnithine racemase